MLLIHHCKKSFLFLTKGLIISLLIITPFLGLNAAYPNCLSHLDVILSQHTVICTLFRWTILMAAFLFWPVIFRKMGQIRHWPSAKVEYWIKQRARIIVWMFLFELIVCENIFVIIFNHGKLH